MFVARFRHTTKESYAREPSMVAVAHKIESFSYVEHLKKTISQISNSGQECQMMGVLVC
jgi:hypothetical protein